MTDLSLASANAPKLVVRVDANPEIALGHLKRCLSLAEALRLVGMESVFVTNGDPESRRLLVRHGFRQYVSEARIGSAADWTATCSVVTETAADAILIDSYEVDAFYLRRFQAEGIFVICLDDLGERELACDLLINGSLDAESIDYNPGCKSRLLGVRYCILDRTFSDPQIRPIESVRNVLITMGGIDHYNLTVSLLQILEQKNEEFTITVIIGPFYENRKEIERQISRMKRDALVEYSPDDLYKVMVDCDLAFSAGGRTLYELATLGRPTIGIALWKNQYLNVSQLAQLGIICGLHYGPEEGFLKELADSSDRIFRDNHARRLMAETGRRIFDGRGATRVAVEVARRVQERRNHLLCPTAFFTKEDTR